MKTVRVKKGYHLKVVGSPSTALQETERPDRLAVLPERIPFVKPRLKVAKGDRVALGSPLFEDKRDTDIHFLSPGGGQVADIRFGPRRVIQEIVIELDDNEESVEFERYGQADVDRMSREQLVRALVSGGLWPLIRELPFRDYARTDFVPPAVFIRLGSLEPFHPAPQIYLHGEEELFRFGWSVLNKLAGEVEPLVFGQVFANVISGELLVAKFLYLLRPGTSQHIDNMGGAENLTGLANARKKFLGRYGNIG